MLGDSSKAIAATAANFISADDIALIRKNIAGLKESHLAAASPEFSHVYEKMDESEKAGGATLNLAIEKYLKYMKLLANVKEVNNISSPINIYVKDKNRLRLILSSDRTLLLDVPYSMRPEAENAFSSNSPQSTKVYKDKDGMWISAFAPISSPASPSAQAIIGIDNKIDLYLARLKSELLMIIMVCLLGFLGAAALGYELVNNLSAAIKKLNIMAGELERENYNIRVEVKSENEIGHLAETFEKMRLSIRKKIDELKLSIIKEKRAHLESIIALTNAMEVRDPYTKKHLYRVDKYAMLIAKAMRLPKGDIEKLRYGCYIHDIGKIYLEGDLLEKKKLSESEYIDIKKHSEKGSKIIEGIPFLKEVKEIILYHQEHYDGTGYPKGLKGKDIPLLARIVAVTDAFDAMTTDRPYRPKLDFKEALSNIEKGAGTQFDPDVCKAFLKYRNVIEKIANKHF